jgi:hypothetical protein
MIEMLKRHEVRWLAHQVFLSVTERLLLECRRRKSRAHVRPAGGWPPPKGSDVRLIYARRANLVPAWIPAAELRLHRQ